MNQRRAGYLEQRKVVCVQQSQLLLYPQTLTDERIADVSNEGNVVHRRQLKKNFNSAELLDSDHSDTMRTQETNLENLLHVFRLELERLVEDDLQKELQLKEKENQ